MYVQLIERLKAANYEIHLFVVDVPLEIAKIRSDRRGENTGRYVPHSIIESTHQLVPKTFAKIKKECDSFKLYDNQNGLKLIASNNFIDEKKYRLFMDKIYGGKIIMPIIKLK
ncbi:zeta toxin family protein [Salipaludibacillus sp. CF4.18]|uniref:zeta toxin family protein n=1 Tax=Salipaludibacillus sp. CF4.18 TaxID=3373081 RepID=UPI003EE5FB80